MPKGTHASGIDTGGVAAFARGTTVARNALLEIARQELPSPRDLIRGYPPALVPRELRFTARERSEPGGEIEPLDEGSLKEVVDALKAAEVEAVAVCPLLAFLHHASVTVGTPSEGGWGSP